MASPGWTSGSWSAWTGDAFQYDVTYAGRSVTAYDSNMPPALEPAVAILSRLVSQHGGLCVPRLVESWARRLGRTSQ